MTNIKDPLARLGVSPDGAGSWWLTETRLFGFRRPRATVSCSCGQSWAGSYWVILDAAEHLALRRRQLPEHRVLIQWTTSCTMLARKGQR